MGSVSVEVIGGPPPGWAVCHRPKRTASTRSSNLSMAVETSCPIRWGHTTRRSAARRWGRDGSAAPRPIPRPDSGGAVRYLFGAPGTLSLVNTSRFFAVYDAQLGGTSSSSKIAVTGHSGTHAPQSMHSSGWM
jgi:hypothetical protein